MQTINIEIGRILDPDNANFHTPVFERLLVQMVKDVGLEHHAEGLTRHSSRVVIAHVMIAGGGKRRTRIAAMQARSHRHSAHGGLIGGLYMEEVAASQECVCTKPLSETALPLYF